MQEGEDVTITFEGNRVFEIDKPVHGRVLFCKMDGLSAFFIVLKNKTIFSLDDRFPSSLIREMVDQYEALKEAPSFEILENYIKL